MQLSAEDFVANLEKSQGLGATLLEGENAYVEDEFKRQLKSLGVEVHDVEIKKTGPEPMLEDLSMGGSLFSSASLMWVKKIAPVSGWTEKSFDVWRRICDRVDGKNFSLWVQIPQDRRYKWTDLGIKNKVLLDVVPDKLAFWLKRMNLKHKAGLDAKRLQFLLENDSELLDIEKWIELWAIGGDTWASRSLGFGSAAGDTPLKKLLEGQGNPAYVWVDAVLRGDKRRSVPLVNHLLSEGEEPLSLLALLSKSVRLLATLEAGSEGRKQAPFLVQKVRAVLTANRRTFPRRGHELLDRCADLDRTLKSTALSARVLMEQL